MEHPSLGQWGARPVGPSPAGPRPGSPRPQPGPGAPATHSPPRRGGVCLREPRAVAEALGSPGRPSAERLPRGMRRRSRGTPCEPPGLRLGEAPGGGTSPLLTAAGPQVPVHQAAAGGAGALAHSGSGWEHPAKPRGAASGTQRRPSPGALGPDDFAWGCTGWVAGRPSPPAPLPDRDGRASRPPAPRGDDQSQPCTWRASWGLGEASRGQAGAWAQPGTDGWPPSRVGDEAPSGHP